MLAKNGIVCENAEFSESESVVKAEKCELSENIAQGGGAFVHSCETTLFTL